MNLQALKPIKHNGKRYKVGETIENIDEKQAKRLINLGAATNMVAVPSFIEPKGNQNQDPSNNSDDDTDSTENNNTEGNIDLTGESGLGTADDLISDEEVFQLIWDKFKHEELKEQSAELKLEFAGNISKTDLINLIIEEEKEDHFLDQIEQ